MSCRLILRVKAAYRRAGGPKWCRKPARLCSLKNLMCHGSRGQGGLTSPCRRSARMRNRRTYRSDRFVEPALRTHCSLCNPRGLVRGHPARYPRSGTCSFRHLSTAESPAGKMAIKTTQAPLPPHQGAPGPGRNARNVPSLKASGNPAPAPNGLCHLNPIVRYELPVRAGRC